ncbi:MAG TPA: endo-1,4-beta-xylanase, partial [Armatimonadota bacterium]
MASTSLGALFSGLAALLALSAAGGIADAANLLSPEAFPLQVSGNRATLDWVSVPGAPRGTGKVLRIVVREPSQPFYLLSTGQALDRPQPGDRKLRLSFWGRSANRNPIRVVLEKTGPPYTAYADLLTGLSPAWKRYSVAETAPAAGRGELSVRLQFGHQAGTLELAGISLEDAGPDRELMTAEEAIKPELVRQRIERYRKGALTVAARDARGRPLPGCRVSVRQVQHAFFFGCNIFGLNPKDKSPGQLTYQRRSTRLLNFATLPFYWGAFEPEQGKPQYARLDAMAVWCRDHGLVTKGHPLVWHEVYPRWAPQDPKAAIPLLRQRVHDLLTHYRGLVRYWDVQNEANNSATYPRTGVGQWVSRDGPAKVVETTLGWARKDSKGSGQVLLYNDFDVSQRNIDLLKELARRHALPDVIGIQSHMHLGNWPLETVWQRTQRFAQFGRPLHYTELTVLSGPPRGGIDLRNPPTDWLTTPEGEAAQAQYVESFYRLLFSHPSVQAITWWDLADRDAWQNAPAGLLRKDLSPKPAYDRLMKLVRGEWWTRASG